MDTVCLDCKKVNQLTGKELQQPKCVACQNNLPWIVDADDTDMYDHLQIKMPILLDFWGVWCGPCKQLSPVITELAGFYRGKLKVIKADIDNTKHFAQFYKVSALPTILVGKGGPDGAFAEQIVGNVPRKKLTESIDKVLLNK